MQRIGYNSWSLSRQLQLNLVFFSMLICATLVIITRYQLDWMINEVLDQYSSLLITSLSSQVSVLLSSKSEHIEREILTYMLFAQKLHDLEELIFGFTQFPRPILAPAPVQNSIYSAHALDYTTGCFYSSLSELSAQGLALEATDAAMDPLYPLLHQSKYLHTYAGFETDQIIHFFPASLMPSTTYNPLAREWYYTAKDSPNNFSITEPYPDAITAKPVITVSKAIVDKNNTVVGVAACDVTFPEMATLVSNIKILQNGFLILVSAGGIVISAPEQWGISKTDLEKVYNQTATGISTSLWDSIVQSPDATKFEFNRDGTNFLLYSQSVRPFDDKSIITHYVVAIADKDEVLVPIGVLYSSYTQSNYLIFILVAAISGIIFFAVTLMLHFMVKKFKAKLGMIKKLFARITHRALLIKVIQSVSFNELDENRKDIESLVNATKIKVSAIRDLEDQYSYFPWNITRPGEVYLFDKWKKKFYPFNLYNMTSMSWRNSINKLVTKHND
jgi:hypothetical protein